MIALDRAIANFADSTRELWAGAAVRERFRAGELLAQWLKDHTEADAASQRSAMDATIAIQDVAKPASASDGSDALRLPTEMRMRALNGLGANAARSALDAVPFDSLTLVERMFRQLLSGDAVPINTSDREQMVALRMATVSAVAVGLTPQLSEKELTFRIQRLDLMLSLGGPDLHRFIGRAEDLAQLHSLWQAGALGAAVTGPGGMGKSLLASRFVADLLDNARGNSPVAVFHLDYDRPDLREGGKSRSASLDILTSELMRQGRRWLPSAQIDELLKNDVHAGASWASESSTFSRGTGQHTMRGASILSLARLFSGQGFGQPRVVLIFDSMEQILGFDDEAVNSIRYATSMMIQAGVRPFILCISRSFHRDQGIVDWLGGHLIDLGQFTDDEARTYLANEAARGEVSLDVEIVDRVIATVGRSPLALRLAIALIEKDTGAFDALQWAKSLRDDPERIQASLYDRVLKRIRDPDLAKIARPGLLVRRLSQNVIEQVLAKPCGLDLSRSGAEYLLYKGHHEGQLFVVNRSDPEPGALWHRADVRALMLPDLDVTVDETVAREINLLAVEFYAASDDVISRTEELYHRLRLGQSRVEIDKRWSASAGASLRTVLDELPPESRRYVRNQLGSASLAVVDGASGSFDSSGNELREVVRRELQSIADGANPMATLSRFGADKMSGPLADLYAEALLASGQIDALLSSAAQLSVSRQAPLSTQAAVSNIAAGALEGLGRLAEAFEYWRAAVDTAPLADEESIHLAISARIGALRTARKQDEIRHFAGYESNRRTEIEETLQIASRVLESLSRRAVESRELIAELSDPALEHPVPPTLFRTLAHLVEGGESFPSLIANSRRASTAAQRLGTQFDSLRGLVNYLSKAIYTDQVKLVIVMMREEVDWTLERAVGLPAGSTKEVFSKS